MSSTQPTEQTVTELPATHLAWSASALDSALLALSSWASALCVAFASSLVACICSAAFYSYHPSTMGQDQSDGRIELFSFVSPSPSKSGETVRPPHRVLHIPPCNVTSTMPRQLTNGFTQTDQVRTSLIDSGFLDFYITASCSHRIPLWRIKVSGP